MFIWTQLGDLEIFHMKNKDKEIACQYLILKLNRLFKKIWMEEAVLIVQANYGQTKGIYFVCSIEEKAAKL